jgi:hypothetical protein
VDIGKVDGVNEPSLNKPQQQDKRSAPRTEDVRKTDDVDISSEAREAAELARLISLAKDIPEVRDAMVAEAKARLESENADDEQINRTTARRLLEELL